MTPHEFKQLRKDLGLSQRQMANKLGLKNYRTVQRYESGEQEIGGAVLKLCEIYLEGLSINDTARI